VITFVPYRQETIVSSHHAEDLARRLGSVTRAKRTEDWMPAAAEDAMLFNGQVKNRRFTISRKVRRANNFLPLMRGRIEPTSIGSIVFVRYQLFLWTLSFLIFWLVVTCLMAVYFFFYEKIYSYAAISLLLGLTNYAIALLNFNKQVRISSQSLRDVLN